MRQVDKRIASEALQAEARNASVVKCDIVGSTRIMRTLDLDDQLLFKRIFENLIAEVTERNFGYVERFEGDGALIVFGYPTAIEGAPIAAIRTGLELVDALATVQQWPGVQLKLRVGIASGRVAVIQQPADPKSQPVTGHTIDLAERLRALADPGRIVIDDSTRRSAGSFFDYLNLGQVVVKGFEEGVQAWGVVRASSVVSRFEAQRFDESRSEIVGRQEILTELFDAWSAASDGNGKTVCLIGDAGLGKSRLAKAALDLAAESEATILKIDCTPSTGNTPLFPVGVLLRRTASITAVTPNQERLELAQQLLNRLLGPEEGPAALTCLAPLFGIDSTLTELIETPEQVRDQTISTLVAMIRSLARQNPLALLCEDLHWADATTIGVIEKAADHIAGSRILLLITSRHDPEVEADIKDAVTIVLTPLDPLAATDLVRTVAKGATLSEDAVHRIVVRCEGVPLLLEELTRDAVEPSGRGELIAKNTAPGNEVPAPLAAVVESRLGRWPQLSPIIKAASVLGRDFSVRVLEQMVSPAHRERVVEAISLLPLFAQRTHPGDRARFKHAMICDAVYNTLLGRDRERLHSQAADVLDAGYQATPDGSPEVIAEHLRKSARFLEAIRIRLAASSDTAARGAYVETEGHCEAALSLIDKVSDEEQRRMLQFKLLVQLGVALAGRYGYAASEVEDAYRKAQAVCGDSAEAEMLYPIIRGLATLNLVRGNLGTANELSLRGLQLADRSSRPEFRIDALSVHCYTTLYYGRLEECRLTIDRCLHLYRHHRGETLTYPVPQDAATAALALLPTVSWLLGDSGACEQAIGDGLEHVNRLNRDFDKALLHSWIAGTRYTQRRYLEAMEHAQRAVAISQQHGYREWYGIGLLMELLAKSAIEASPEALAQATETCMAFAREGVNLNASYYLWALARGYVQVGDTNTARLMLEQAFRQAQASEESRMNAELLMLQAECEPDAPAAIDLLTKALALADEQGAVAVSLRAAATLVLRSDADEADLEEARAVLDFLDCRECYPTEPRWMHSRLEHFRKVVYRRLVPT